MVLQIPKVRIQQTYKYSFGVQEYFLVLQHRRIDGLVFAEVLRPLDKMCARTGACAFVLESLCTDELDIWPCINL